MQDLSMRIASLFLIFLVSAFLTYSLLYWERFSLIIKKRLQDKIRPEVFVLSLLILIGLLISFNVRFMVFDLTFIKASDEAIYIDILTSEGGGKYHPVSGPGFRYLVLFIHDITSIEIAKIVAGFATLVCMIYLIPLFLVYDHIQDRIKNAGLACVFLLITSYFLWPMLEGRPQQVGMLIYFVSVVMFYFYLHEKKFQIVFIILFFIAFVYHLLTFMLISTSVFLIWWWEYSRNRSDIKTLTFPAIVFLICLASLVPGLLYEKMVGSIVWTFEHSALEPIAHPIFIVVVALVPFFLLTLIGAFLRKRDILDRAMDLTKKYSKQISIVVAIAVVLAIVIQYWINSETYSYKYRNNFMLFILFQLGNVAFGIAFIAGLYKFLKRDEKPNVFLQASLSLMVVGGAIIIPSLVLPVGFNNWFIRVINYWTLMAAPIALISLEYVPKRFKRYLVVLIPLLFVLSLININKDPFFLNIP